MNRLIRKWFYKRNIEMIDGVPYAQTYDDGSPVYDDIDCQSTTYEDVLTELDIPIKTDVLVSLKNLDEPAHLINGSILVWQEWTVLPEPFESEPYEFEVL